MDTNPYRPPQVRPLPPPKKPVRRWVGSPIWRVVLIAGLVGGAVNFGGWLWARDGVRAPRRLLFAPAVLAGLQDMSDPHLGVLSAAVLFAAYASALTSAKNRWSWLIATIFVIAMHAACLAAVESRGPPYAF